METDELIRRQIRLRMQERGLTQAELARQMGITPPSLAQVLSSRRGRVPASLLDVLQALDLQLDARPTQEKPNG